jgi:hypothetical protein
MAPSVSRSCAPLYPSPVKHWLREAPGLAARINSLLTKNGAIHPWFAFVDRAHLLHLRIVQAIAVRSVSGGGVLIEFDKVTQGHRKIDIFR